MDVSALFTRVASRLYDCTSGLSVEMLSPAALETWMADLNRLGGGWLEKIPFDCVDACATHAIELLAADSSGNWNMVPADVRIESESPEIQFDGPVAEGGVVVAPGCSYDLVVGVGLTEGCGLLSYTYVLEETNGTTSLIDEGEGSDVAGSFEITADALNVGEYLLKVRISDECGNESFGSYTFAVSSLNCITANSVSVMGSIETELLEKIVGVDIQIWENGKEENVVTTDADGHYVLNFQHGSNLQLGPKKDLGDADGVSTADLIILQKHLLGQELLQTTYKMEAADVNNDGRIKVSDLVDMRRLILGINNEFADSDSWRFYDRNTEESIFNTESLQVPTTVDWVGVKIGDLNLDYSSTRALPRAGSPLVFQVPDVEMKIGQQYRVDFTSANFDELQGYQYTLAFDATTMKIVGISYGDTLRLTDAHFNLEQADQGFVTTSWHVGEGFEPRINGLSVDSEEVIFSLIIEGKENRRLSDVLTINSQRTKAEAYDVDLSVSDVSLEFTRDKILDGDFALFQNMPNPFKTNTRIGFYLPHATSATLRLFDVSGRQIKTIERNYLKGYHEEEIISSDLQRTGVIYYQLETPEYVATRRMVLLE